MSDDPQRPVVQSGFEAHGWKIMSGLVITGIIAGASLLVSVDKRLALVEQQLVLSSTDRWTRGNQEAYAALAESEHRASSARVTRNELDIMTLRTELEKLRGIK